VSGSPDVVELYVRAAALFGEQVASVPGDHWDMPTPCPDWDVRSVVTHVVYGDAQLPDLVAGRGVLDVDLDVSVLGSDPIAVWRGTALRAIEVSRATPLDRVVQHPAGDLTFGTVLGFRVTESAVHAWDIARALSRTLELPDDLAEWCLDFWSPMVDSLSQSRHFAAMRQPLDETAGSRLLALLGRSA
jgi:uncharacterized protein (TIGR03086 family)